MSQTVAPTVSLDENPPVNPDEPVYKLGKDRGPNTSKRWSPKRILVWISLLGCTAIFAYPFVWLISASLKPRSQVFDNKLIPKDITFSNYATVWTDAPIGVWLANSVMITVLAAVSVTLASALVAWGFAYFKFPGRNKLFGVVLATMMLPGMVTMIPQYLIWNGLGLVGSDAPANGTLPMWAGNLFGSAFYIFLIRQFFLGLPRDPFEAAKLDGANNWKIFWKIGIPLSKPAIVVTMLFEIQAAWTELQRALIYLQDSSQFTVPRGLKALVDKFGFGGEWHWEIIVTASVITTIPMIIVFFFGQKSFMDGIATTGSKG
jgi:multiple sugar transport system permease protein